jgi:small subunit ribosomal protein S18
MYKKRVEIRVNKKCQFCKARVNEIDYKDVATLSRFLDRWNKIQPGSRSGACARHQRWLTRAIKNARHLALLPYVAG